MGSRAAGKAIFSTKWFRLVEKTSEGQPEPYYVVESPDCVTILAVTAEGKIPLVRQYRPVLDSPSLELPSGHVNPSDASYEDAARRELLEETGYRAGKLEFLGALNPDLGRLSARIWCYFAPEVVRAGLPQDGEEQIELIECAREEMLDWVRDGNMLHAQDLALILLGRLKGFI
jgi:ADP-ribose pyrophosphatase